VCTVEEKKQIDLDKLQRKIEDLVFRWTGAGAPLDESLKDSIERLVDEPKMIKYFYGKLVPKFYLEKD
jgi:hypothetical protein